MADTVNNSSQLISHQGRHRCCCAAAESETELEENFALEPHSQHRKQRANQTIQRNIDYMVANLNRPSRIATVAVQVNAHNPQKQNPFKMKMSSNLVRSIRRQVGSAELNCSSAGSHPAQSQSRAMHIIKPSVNYMLQHLGQPLRISTLSALAGVSTSYFFTLFKSATGYTPINFFIRLRMHRACELLRHEKLSVKETADRLGYNDPFYFSRMFKLVTGLAPGSYRQLILESPQAESSCSSVFSRWRPSLSLNSPMTGIANPTPENG